MVANKDDKKSFRLVSKAPFLKERKERIVYVIIALSESPSVAVEFPLEVYHSHIFVISNELPDERTPVRGFEGSNMP